VRGGGGGGGGGGGLHTGGEVIMFGVIKVSFLDVWPVVLIWLPVPNRAVAEIQ